MKIKIILGKTEEEVENYVEALTEWVIRSNPTTFYWISSDKYPAYNTIASKLSKKIKRKTRNFLKP